MQDGGAWSERGAVADAQIVACDVDSQRCSVDAANERPAAQRAGALKDRDAFIAETDDGAYRAVVPRNERL
jgi:hypothetical protein